MSPANPMKFVVGGVAAVAIALGAYAIGNSNSGNGSSGTASAAQTGQAGQPPGGGHLPRNGRVPPGFAAPATGAAADRARSAALARYKGSVEQVVKLSDGSYVVHVIASSTEYHVHVSKDFKVTGADQGGPGGAGRPRGVPPGGAPQGAPPGSSNWTP